MGDVTAVAGMRATTEIRTKLLWLWKPYGKFAITSYEPYVYMTEKIFYRKSNQRPLLNVFLEGARMVAFSKEIPLYIANRTGKYLRSDADKNGGLL